uniref:Uncharacterized protein n=1 Tax=Romanomermis culicivorax TaxID=13658 RepID=A0A915IK04_ROMCU
MGKKVKIGKQRRDKFYRLAKEAGLRSRAVFKLTQLNRKFEFLQKSQVLVDLCAAPGGWLQVASKHMPMSSVIIGVDLAPIKAMPNIITLQDDITTEHCRQAVKSQLQNWLADCVLNDGAPNVGKNWAHDAFMQAQLTLSALRLATEVLKRGGWFVTKIFRSKDHPALVEVFKKLFKKVFVTKPEASRAESAEIYVVCKGYLKPEKVDPQLLDPKCVFVELNLEPEKPKLNLLHPEKRKKRAEGYAEGDYTLHHCLTAKNFIESDKHLEDLADTNQIVFSKDCEVDQSIFNHPSTTEEIKACCLDIKVLGRKELRDLLNWRKKIRQHLSSLKPKEEKAVNEKIPEVTEEVDEEIELDNYVSSVSAEEKREAKKKRKKLMAEKRKVKKKLDLKMAIPGDQHDYAEEADLFNLRRIKNKERTMGEMDISSDISDREDVDMELNDEDFDNIGDIPDSDEEQLLKCRKIHFSTYSSATIGFNRKERLQKISAADIPSFSQRSFLPTRSAGKLSKFQYSRK